MHLTQSSYHTMKFYCLVVLVVLFIPVALQSQMTPDESLGLWGSVGTTYFQQKGSDNYIASNLKSSSISASDFQIGFVWEGILKQHLLVDKSSLCVLIGVVTSLDNLDASSYSRILFDSSGVSTARDATFTVNARKLQLGGVLGCRYYLGAFIFQTQPFIECSIINNFVLSNSQIVETIRNPLGEPNLSINDFTFNKINSLYERQRNDFPYNTYIPSLQVSIGYQMKFGTLSAFQIALLYRYGLRTWLNYPQIQENTISLGVCYKFLNMKEQNPDNPIQH